MIQRRRQGKAWAAWTLVVVATTLIAGCVGTEKQEPTPLPPVALDAPDPGLLIGARDLRIDLLPTDPLPAPIWNVGDHFGLHVYFGSDDTDGFHFDAVVAAAGTDGYHLAAADPQVARQHAIFDFPMLGRFGTDLSGTGLGGAWNILGFPLSDGKTWKGEIPNIAYDIIPDKVVPLDLTATYQRELLLGDRTFPGYTVVGDSADGTRILEYDYIPMLGWFSRLIVYDIDPGQDPLEFSAYSMGHGTGWTGTLYDDVATLVVDNQDGSGFDKEPWEGGRPFARPAPHGTFTLSADATYLIGFIEQDAVAGIRETRLVTPSGEQREVRTVGAPEGGDGIWIEEPAEAGEWTFYTVGAGGYSGATIVLWSVIEDTIIL